MNDEKCMQLTEWRNEKIREKRGICQFWLAAQTGRELTHAPF